MASELKINHHSENQITVSNSNDTASSDNTSGGLTEYQLECLERDIAQAKSLFGNLHDHSIPFFRNLFVKGLQQPMDFNVPLDNKPEWLDIEKFNRGRKFALNNISGIMFSELVSTILLFSVEHALPPLIFTHATDSPFKCFVRYTSTFKRLKSWYDQNIWDDDSKEAKNNMRVVRSMHKNLYLKISSCTPEVLKKKSLLAENEGLHSFHLYKLLKEDAVNYTAFRPEIPIKDISVNWVSQTATAFVQWAFAGLLVNFPEKFGVHNVKEDDLEAFTHMWRAMGYLLGIKDEFNVFAGDLKTVRQRTQCITDLVIKPSLMTASPDWEYLSRCLVDGTVFYANTAVPLEETLLYALHVLNLEAPKLRKHLTLGQLFVFHSMKFMFEYLYKFSIIRTAINFFTLKTIRKVEEASPELLNEWKAKKFYYVPKDNN